MAKVMYPEAIFRVKDSGRSIFLTFDDGPTPGLTKKLIAILKRTNVPATFFCSGSNIKAHKLIFEEMVNAGFSIGNHGNDHLDGWRTEREDYITDARAGSQMSGSELFRPPYGHLLPYHYRKLQKENTIVFWDILVYDFREEIMPHKMVEPVIRKIRPGSIIVMHDNERSKAPDILEDIILQCKGKGFRFEDLGLVLTGNS